VIVIVGPVVGRPAAPHVCLDAGITRGADGPQVERGLDPTTMREPVMLRLACPYCTAPYEVPDLLAGLVVRCAACGAEQVAAPGRPPTPASAAAPFSWNPAIAYLEVLLEVQTFSRALSLLPARRPRGG
jgi:hypothetical protein